MEDFEPAETECNGSPGNGFFHSVVGYQRSLYCAAQGSHSDVVYWPIGFVSHLCANKSAESASRCK